MHAYDGDRRYDDRKKDVPISCGNLKFRVCTKQRFIRMNGTKLNFDEVSSNFYPIAQNPISTDFTFWLLYIFIRRQIHLFANISAHRAEFSGKQVARLENYISLNIVHY
jgi:hypothetical protein